MDDRTLNKIARKYESFVAKDLHIADKYSYTMVKRFARRNKMSAVTVRKILISVGSYDSDRTRIIGALFRDGNCIKEIQRITGLTRATVYSYLPYRRNRYSRPCWLNKR